MSRIVVITEDGFVHDANTQKSLFCPYTNLECVCSADCAWLNTVEHDIKGQGLTVYVNCGGYTCIGSFIKERKDVQNEQLSEP